MPDLLLLGADVGRLRKETNAARWVVNLRDRICYLMSRLKIHNPDCANCNARETCWGEMRKRLEELSWQTQRVSVKNLDHVEVLESPDSKLPNL